MGTGVREAAAFLLREAGEGDHAEHGGEGLVASGQSPTPRPPPPRSARSPSHASRGRIAAIDAARGAALIGMAAYHFSWDLAYFGLAAPNFPLTPPMRLFSHCVAGAFLALVGASLVLAHHDGFHRRAFQRRLALICGAAALVTIATAILAPQDAIYFGILHCIAVASLLAAPLLQTRLWAPFAAAGFAFLAPVLFAGPAFNQPAVIWLGLNTAPPSTFDWRPLAPWSGLVFLGLAFARLWWRPLTESRLATWRPRAVAARALAWAGRRSLPIYLIHQPVLFALLFAATGFASPDARRDEVNFRNVCLAQCGRAGGTADHCQRGCQCVVGGLRDAGLAIAFSRAHLDDAQHKRFSSIVQACARAP
ncbi:MAG TPA: heparan-alpha-glucosaminide N-acetyltransferase [Roseiarcus sp.]|nr:heparan-alpha-glucosaminide N-acetyltransferase [Roseiarcus sp.]